MKLLSVKEVAAKYGRDESTVKQNAQRGAIKAQKIGYYWVISEKDAVRFYERDKIKNK